MLPDPRDDEELLRAYFWLSAVIMIIIGLIVSTYLKLH